VEQGRSGRCWPGWAGSGAAEEAPARVEGGPGSGATGEAPARAERVGHGRGRLGSGAVREAPARRSGSTTGEAGVGRRCRGAGCGGSARSSCGGGGARRYTTRGKRCVRERSGRKKGRDRVYSLMFVGPTHQPMNISGLAYVAVVVAYVHRAPDEHKLHMLVLKPKNII
jgi:hypothetical protein